MVEYCFIVEGSQLKMGQKIAHLLKKQRKDYDRSACIAHWLNLCRSRRQRFDAFLALVADKKSKCDSEKWHFLQTNRDLSTQQAFVVFFLEVVVRKLFLRSEQGQGRRHPPVRSVA